jgi:hypothetical protein
MPALLTLLCFKPAKIISKRQKRIKKDKFEAGVIYKLKIEKSKGGRCSQDMLEREKVIWELSFNNSAFFEKLL